MTDRQAHRCPECDSIALYHRQVATAGAYGPALLPGLGGFLSFAKADVVVCAACGLMRMYAEPAARRKLPEAKGWTRGLPPPRST